MLPDYSKEKIYKLVSNKTDDVYIGSCLMTLSTRLSKHRGKCNLTSSKKLFENEAIITIVLIEACPCNSKNELKARELFHITNTPCININKPFISESTGKEWTKEYKIAHKERIDEQKKLFYESNKEQILVQRKKYTEMNRERINARRRELYQIKKALKATI